jgi:hypothetical protein
MSETLAEKTARLRELRLARDAETFKAKRSHSRKAKRKNTLMIRSFEPDHHITETDMHAPTLYAIYVNGGTLRTGQVLRVLERVLPLSDGDTEILPSLPCHRYEQIGRNMMSNRSLEKTGYAERIANDGYGWKLTASGERWVENNLGALINTYGEVEIKP